MVYFFEILLEFLYALLMYPIVLFICAINFLLFFRFKYIVIVNSVYWRYLKKKDLQYKEPCFNEHIRKYYNNPLDWLLNNNNCKRKFHSPLSGYGE